MEASPQLRKTAQVWARKLNQCIEHDSWGHVIEASEGYESLAKELAKFVQTNSVGAQDRSIIGKLGVSLRLRAESASCVEVATTGEPRMSVDEIRTLPQVFESLFTGSLTSFPIDLSNYSASKAQIEARLQRELANGMVKELSEDGEPQETPVVEFSGTAISITIDKIGLKDAQEGYINSHFTVTVAEEGSGEIVEGEPPIDTAFSSGREPQYINFGHTMTLKKSLEHLEQIPGVAIFFEFKHYKTKGEYVSTKCYSFMELDELRDGPVLLEILKCQKPTDFARKAKPSRLSVKELYLHLNIELTHK